MDNLFLGIDIGGSGIKGAVVDITTGELVQPRFRVATPKPGNPAAIAGAVKELTEHFNWQGPVGCGFPGVVMHGKVLTAANLDKSCAGVDFAKLFTQTTQCPTFLLNDADAAGIAEMNLGNGKNTAGVVVIVTVGTGIGTALFTNGHLVPNTEFGHIILDNRKEGEKYAADSVRQKQKLSWKDWGNRFNHYLNNLVSLFYPDLIIVGGGASKEFRRYQETLTVKTKVIPAALLNKAGIIGAAMYAAAETAPPVQK
ncbi:ROK family protein [Sphingobacteriales bacterium UPWRP_1]|nr:polyphosphate glucokinase [Sphingobacteriales bacterium TSM_CSS]PSJ73555.1 ROK family protein [Sphingobacteriales bacterium UPWRP_1]